MNSKPRDKSSASGGGNWTSVIAAAIVCSVGLAVWRTLWSKKKMEELEERVQIHQDYIDQDKQVKLVDLENLLVERQHIFCSPFIKQKSRQQLEDQIQQKAKTLESLVPDIKIRLQRIFSEDHKCGSSLTYIWTRDKTQNGELMWKELEDWKRRARTSQDS
ncbi:hypothetical protein PAMP_024057 [Pampus punctatissimus]